MSPSISSPKNRVFFFSHPRTASNLLVRLLSEQKGWTYDEYNFLLAYQYVVMNVDLEDPASVSEETWTEYCKQMTGAYEKMETFLSTADEEQTHSFTKEHALMLMRPDILFPGLHKTSPLSSSPHTNPTILPDSLLLTFQPLLAIRHPALVFESWHRVNMTENYPTPLLTTSLHPQRLLYDWYTANTHIQPIVVDADDVIERPEIVRQICGMLGMDEGSVRFEWEAVEEGEKEKMGKQKSLFLGSLIASKGVIKGKSGRGLDLATKEQDWRREFGDERAEWLMGRVEDAMSDYEFLRERRVV